MTEEQDSMSEEQEGFEYFDKMSFKCVFVGEDNVGMSSLLMTYAKGVFPEEDVPIVYDNFSKEVINKDSKFLLQIWDTSGEEEYNKARTAAYYDTDCFVLCFDLVDRDSFDSILEKIYKELVEHNVQDTPILLLGTKYDLRINEKVCNQILEEKGEEKRVVDVSEAEEMLNKIEGFKYLQCSAKILFNVQEIFTTVLSYLQEPYVPEARRKKEEEKKQKLEEDREQQKSSSGLFASFSKKKLLDEITDSINYDFDHSDDEDD